MVDQRIGTRWCAAGTAETDLAMTPTLRSSVRVHEGACPAVGTMIHGVYRILGPLGAGGMGFVMLARDEQLARDVAIKFVIPEIMERPGLRARFLSEARAMARVRHPNVVQIYAFGEHEGAPYFVMEYVEGQTLQSWLEARGDAPPDRAVALRMLDDACRGVAAIHAAGNVHRDLKPSNLLLDGALNLRVADFGVADLLPRLSADGTPEIVGTPEYMAPEIVAQDDVPTTLAYRVDVYSLGCLAFELLTGSPPFPDEEAHGRMLIHLVQEPDRPSQRRPELGTDFDDVILGTLAKDPAERTPTVEAFRLGLRAANEQTGDPVRILVADDDDDFRHLLAVSLARDFPGVEIESVGDGIAALKAFDEKHHSVAIIDLQMPGLDGMELTERLRTRAGADGMPIIVITANGGAAEWKRLVQMGADGFLVKPVNVRDVTTLVRRALGDRRTAPSSLR